MDLRMIFALTMMICLQLASGSFPCKLFGGQCISALSTCKQGMAAANNGKCCHKKICCIPGGPESTPVTTPKPAQDWITVFVGCSGIGDTVWSTYNASNPDYCNEDSELNETCPAPHQICQLSPSWSSSVEKVRLRLWKDNITVVEIVFNGTGSDRFDWFQPSRLLSSSYDDMNSTSDYTFFSIEGYAPSTRRFYLNNNNYRGCGFDGGWMFVKDNDEGNYCSYDAYDDYPYFIYATNNQAGVWEEPGQYDFADMITIEVFTNPMQ